VITALPQPFERYTYADYRSWPDSVRGELLDGIFYDMSPAPSVAHQDAAGGVYAQLQRALKGQRCRAFVAPVDVLLPQPGQGDDAVDRVVQPDVFVVCDPDRIRSANVRGAPDFVVEVLSPATAAKDQIEKLALYEAAGVSEVWLLHPTDRVLTIYIAEPGLVRYGRPRVVACDGRVAILTLDGIEIDFDDIFTG